MTEIMFSSRTITTHLVTLVSASPFTSQTCTLWGVCISDERLCTSELHSYSPHPLEQLDFGDPPQEREGKSAQDSTWGNSLADDCKVVG